MTKKLFVSNFFSFTRESKVEGAPPTIPTRGGAFSYIISLILIKKTLQINLQLMIRRLFY